MNKIWKVSAADKSCPSCMALHNQVHSSKDWSAEKLHPRAARLYCKSNCRCSLDETDAEPSGSFADVPLREEMSKENHITLSLSPSMHDGKFEILAITAGLGNGWDFSEDVLRKSTPLLKKVKVYLDHEDGMSKMKHRTGDLAGVLLSPTWDNTLKGIRAELQPLGPGAQALTKLGEDAIKYPDLLNEVGFSADVAFMSIDKKVISISRYLSVDAVLHPARGGRFIRLLNSIQEMIPMSD